MIGVTFKEANKNPVENTMAVRKRPRRVCLCGSTKFLSAFDVANRDETLAGRIVLTVGVDMHFRDRAFLDATTKGKQERKAVKDTLDWLHKRKIDLADEILVLDVDGRIGKSTKTEIRYAKRKGKRVRMWSEEHPPEDFK